MTKQTKKINHLARQNQDKSGRIRNAGATKKIAFLRAERGVHIRLDFDFLIPYVAWSMSTASPHSLRPLLRRGSCALRTAGFCFFRTPPRSQFGSPLPKMQPLPWEQCASLSFAPCAPTERGGNGVTQ